MKLKNLLLALVPLAADSYGDGKIAELEVTTESRPKDVAIPANLTK